MNRLERAISAIHVLDELAGRNTLVNKLHPLAKLGAVMCFILTVLSFDKYALSGVVAMGIYPVFLYQLEIYPYAKALSALGQLPFCS